MRLSNKNKCKARLTGPKLGYELDLELGKLRYESGLELGDIRGKVEYDLEN